MSLTYIGEQITIYGGLFILIVGVVGNGINVLVFSSVRNYRTTPCTFYFLIASIFNIVYITINLISRIVSFGFGIDLTRTSTSWCKMRSFCLFTLSLITLTCSCLATIDQYFATSQSANLRRFSNIKWAHRIVIIVIIIWCLHGIPVLLFYNISSITTTCVNTNTGYAIYVPIYLLGLICGIPVVIMVLFGYLVYRNIHLTRVLAEQQADRQLTRMILIQILLVVICIVPYSINIAYGLITSGVSKDTNRIIAEGFASTIFSLVSYLYYAVCLFSFFCEIIKQIFLFREVVTCF
jgi:hypothetical protein